MNGKCTCDPAWGICECGNDSAGQAATWAKKLRDGVVNCVVIGKDSIPLHKCCVLIGPNLKSDYDYQIKIGNENIEIAREMTEQEFQTLFAILLGVIA